MHAVDAAVKQNQTVDPPVCQKIHSTLRLAVVHKRHHNLSANSRIERNFGGSSLKMRHCKVELIYCLGRQNCSIVRTTFGNQEHIGKEHLTV